MRQTGGMKRAVASGQPDTLLENRLAAIASRAPGHFTIDAKDLRSGTSARANSNTRVPLLSVVKLPVALAVLDGVGPGQWLLTALLLWNVDGAAAHRATRAAGEGDGLVALADSDRRHDSRHRWDRRSHWRRDWIVPSN